MAANGYLRLRRMIMIAVAMTAMGIARYGVSVPLLRLLP